MSKLVPGKNWGTLKRWEKGESWNPKGQPRKGIALVNHELAAEGYLPATKADIEANYLSMLQLGQEKLTKITNDKERPMLVRIIAKAMLSGKGFDIVERMLDRGIGKAKQVEEIKHEITRNTLSEDEQKAIDNVLKAQGLSK